MLGWKMDIQIDQDILKNTTQCEKNFSCLSCEKRQVCKVKYCAGEKILFVEPNQYEHCSYRMSFGDQFICSCLTRREIHKRYNI